MGRSLPGSVFGEAGEAGPGLARLDEFIAIVRPVSGARPPGMQAGTPALSVGSRRVSEYGKGALPGSLLMDCLQNWLVLGGAVSWGSATPQASESQKTEAQVTHHQWVWAPVLVL